MRISVGEEEFDVVSIYKKEKSGGRPKNILTEEAIELIEKLATVMSTQNEIASCLNTSVDILTNKYNKDSFLDAIKKGNEKGKSSLRNAQFKCALRGNATLLIWLGRQYLGQTDKVEGEIEETDRTVEVKVTTPTQEDYDRVKKMKERLFNDS